MRRLLFVMLAGVGLTIPAASARAQAPAVGTGNPYDATPGSIYGAPGNYGVGYGYASYGVPRTWSAYSSSYGPGYALGYGPSRILPGPYGKGLWGRPGSVAPGYTYGDGSYRTFAVPYTTQPARPGPPVGVYAPAYGPPIQVQAR